MEKAEKEQVKFIREYLESYPACEISDRYVGRLEEISTPTVRKILKNNFNNGPDLKAVLCLFDTLFISSTMKRDKGLHRLSDSVNKWITNMQELPIASAEGVIYITDILSDDIQVVIKIPRHDYLINSFIKEYFIGLCAINKLRYLVPTFMYTLGAFICPKPSKSGELCTTKSRDDTSFVLYEKIPGNSVFYLLHGEINFDQWLCIFYQLLLGLEVAQREVRFTHFDMHSSNVMVRHEPGFTYDINLDNYTYRIADPGLIPVVIDFGFSSVYVADRSIGTYKFPQYGMMRYMVPGYDMFKFMVYSADDSNVKETKEKIMDLFRFYGNDDPYQINNHRDIGVKAAIKEYCKEATYSKVATYTPLMLAEWLWKEYQPQLKQYISVTDRKQYMSIRYSSTIKEYDDIFQQSDMGRHQALKLVDQCIKVRPSYIVAKYTTSVLARYNQELHSAELRSAIDKINMSLVHADHLVAADEAMLEKVFEISLPDEENMLKVIDTVLKISLGIPNFSLRDIAKLDILSYHTHLAPYLQFYYTILELGLEKKFKRWIDKFMASPIWKLYISNCSQVERTLRWEQTLIASMT